MRMKHCLLESVIHGQLGSKKSLEGTKRSYENADNSIECDVPVNKCLSIVSNDVGQTTKSLTSK